MFRREEKRLETDSELMKTLNHPSALREEIQPDSWNLPPAVLPTARNLTKVLRNKEETPVQAGRSIKG